MDEKELNHLEAQLRVAMAALVGTTACVHLVLGHGRCSDLRRLAKRFGEPVGVATYAGGGEPYTIEVLHVDGSCSQYALTVQASRDATIEEETELEARGSEPRRASRSVAIKVQA